MFMHTEEEAVVLCRAYLSSGEAGVLTAIRQMFPFFSPDDEENALSWVRTFFSSQMQPPNAARQTTERVW